MKNIKKNLIDTVNHKQRLENRYSAHENLPENKNKAIIKYIIKANLNGMKKAKFKD